jgi:NAD(P)H-hydrate epimerase
MSIGMSTPRLPARDPSGHKGTFGTVAVIGGRCDASAHMLGGPCLSALASLRAGCGLVRLAMPAPILDAALVCAPEATGVPIPVGADDTLLGHEAAAVIDRLAVECDALAIGPGIGTGPGGMAATLRAVNQQDAPVVVDADALTCLAQTPQVQRDFRARAVLTPHPGEFRRLAASLGVDADPTNPDTRGSAATELAQRLGCVVVLKGARTVVSNGQRAWEDVVACPALATAGSGDVLTGVVASLVAQTFAGHTHVALNLFECACLAVMAHSRAGQSWSDATGASGGMLARDLLDRLPSAVESLRGAVSPVRG